MPRAVFSIAGRHALAQAQSATGLKYAGVNLSGAEIKSSQKPGVLSIDYRYPAADEYAYFAGKHMNTVRLPILWERLQPRAGASWTRPSWR